MRLRRTIEATVEAAPVRAAAAQAPRPPGWQLLGALVLERTGVQHEQLSDALLQQAASGKRLGRQLVELGLLGERDLAEVLGEQLGLPLLDLRATTPAPGAVALVPDGFARTHQCVPLDVVDGVLRVAAAEPVPDLQHRLEQLTGLAVELGIAPAGEVARTVDNTYRSLSAIDDQVRAFEASGAAVKRTASRTEVVGDDAPVVQVVNMILTQALRDRASDVHIEPQDDRVRVRYRIDGALHEVLTLPAVDGLRRWSAASRSWPT